MNITEERERLDWLENQNRKADGWRWELITLVSVVIVLILFWKSVSAEEFRPTSNAYKRSEAAGVITYTPLEGVYIRVSDKEEPDDPKDPDGPLSKVAQEYKDLMVSINDNPNAINVGSLVGAIGTSVRDGKLTFEQATSLLRIGLDNGLPTDSKEVWKAFRTKLSNDLAKLLQEGRQNDLGLFLREVVAGIQAFTGALDEAEARRIVDAAAAVEEAIPWGFILKVVLCILQNSGGENGFAQVLQCIIETLGAEGGGL